MHWWKTAASSNFLKHQTTTKEQSNNNKKSHKAFLTEEKLLTRRHVLSFLCSSYSISAKEEKPHSENQSEYGINHWMEQWNMFPRHQCCKEEDLLPLSILWLVESVVLLFSLYNYSSPEKLSYFPYMSSCGQREKSLCPCYCTPFLYCCRIIWLLTLILTLFSVSL